MSIWKPPASGFLKINLNAAVRPDFVALGCICHDSHDSPLWVRSEILPYMSPLLAEVLAIRMAVGEVATRQSECVLFESDSLVVVSALLDSSVSLPGPPVTLLKLMG